MTNEYTVISGTNSESFIAEINKHLSLGWCLQGGMNYAVTADHHQWYAQSMLRKTDTDPSEVCIFQRRKFRRD